MKNITLTFADLCSLKALEGCASAHDEYSETLDPMTPEHSGLDAVYRRSLRRPLPSCEDGVSGDR